MLGASAGDRGDGNAVVLVVVGKEGEKGILVGRCCAEEGLVVLNHFLELGGTENDVGELGGADHFG